MTNTPTMTADVETIRERHRIVEANMCITGASPFSNGTSNTAHKDRGELLKAYNAQAKRIEELEGHLVWFCRRVEAGEIRSKKTFGHFTNYLNRHGVEWRMESKDAE